MVEHDRHAVVANDIGRQRHVRVGRKLAARGPPTFPMGRNSERSCLSSSRPEWCLGFSRHGPHQWLTSFQALISSEACACGQAAPAFLLNLLDMYLPGSLPQSHDRQRL